MAEKLCELSQGQLELVDVPISDIFVDTSEIDVANSWAKRLGNVLYINIKTVEKSATGWTRPAATFKAPYQPTGGNIDTIVTGYSGGFDGTYSTFSKDNSWLPGTFSYFVESLQGGKNRLSGLITIFI